MKRKNIGGNVQKNLNKNKQKNWLPIEGCNYCNDNKEILFEYRRK